MQGGMAERLGSGLQIRLQRFNSASHLQHDGESAAFTAFCGGLAVQGGSRKILSETRSEAS